MSAQLLYGAFSLMVDMPFVDGRQPTVEEMDQGGTVLDDIAEAIAWLARRGLLYCDVSAANVVVTEINGAPSAHLLVYDDMVIVEPGTVGNSTSLLAAVVANSLPHQEQDCSRNLRGRAALCRRLDELLASPASIA